MGNWEFPVGDVAGALLFGLENFKTKGFLSGKLGIPSGMDTIGHMLQFSLPNFIVSHQQQTGCNTL